MGLAHQQTVHPIARLGGPFVGDDLQMDSACDGVVEAGGWRAAAHIQLSCAQGCDHVRCGLESFHAHIQPLVAKEAFALPDINGRVADAGGDANGDRRLGDGGRGQECTKQCGRDGAFRHFTLPLFVNRAFFFESY